MLDLIIYGAGGFGRETALLVEQINAVEKRWNLIGFYDDKIAKGTRIDSLPVLGGLQDAKVATRRTSLVIAIADPGIREAVANALRSSVYDYPILIHPNAMTGRLSNRIGRGCIITAGCIFTTGITIEDFCIVNLSATIGHDVCVGAFSTIMPGCNISGNVSISRGCMIGTGVQVLQNLRIGEKTKVGAGAVVTKNFGDFATVVGVPAEQIK